MSAIRENLFDTDEITGGEHFDGYHDASNFDPDAITDAEWEAAFGMFARQEDMESDENPFHNDEGPDFEDPRYADTWD
jgi:hypothetical protein